MHHFFNLVSSIWLPETYLCQDSASSEDTAGRKTDIVSVLLELESTKN